MTAVQRSCPVNMLLPFLLTRQNGGHRAGEQIHVQNVDDYEYIICIVLCTMIESANTLIQLCSVCSGVLKTVLSGTSVIDSL